MSEKFQFRSRMPAPAEAVYSFHAEPDALERLTPPWENVQVIARTGSIEQPGSRTTLRVSVGPFSQDWVSEHTACEPGKMFRDVMVAGPFRRWEHTHEFQPETSDTSWLEDRVEYEFPLGRLGKLFGGWYTHRRLQRMFEWRHRITSEILIARKQ
ncbi:MAG TPA: SRPBCC family protein [Candidatus Acidoferrales bacterium]|jgi:ligand-binding SRPBCC domain-containing protein|nr:SRPBCC family protein [Candidatus Acidoferrales bacterium]